MSINVLTSSGIQCEHKLITPELLKKRFPLTEQLARHITASRQTIINIMLRTDPRLLVICGPCSINDTDAAIDYGQRLQSLAEKLQDQLYIVMRLYFEKPRTALGWKGFINDPTYDNTFNIQQGLQSARAILSYMAQLQLPAAMEILDPAVPAYLSDLISWAAIGARTTESQTHREIASSLGMPIGFKNGTNGNIDIAINGIFAASSPHHFIGLNQQGQACTMASLGNPYTHLILRGGSKPNYDSQSIAAIEKKLVNLGLPTNLIIDCSHGNCNRDYSKQRQVAKDVCLQLRHGNRSIIGIMLESYLYPGSQSALSSPNNRQYGVSLTDGCLGWNETELLLTEMAADRASLGSYY